VPLTWRETGRLIRKWRRAEDSPDG
jgi:hypothetical protein